MSLVLRITLAIVLLVTLVSPLIGSFSNEFDSGSLSSFQSSLFIFVQTIGSFLLNVKGVINYFLFKGGGNNAIVVFNGILKVAFLFPVFGLSQKLYMAIYRFTV